jgi:hypothetical protein
VGNDRTLVLTALLFAAGCGAPPERTGEAVSGIQGGSLDARDTGVVGVALLGDNGDIRHTCSGTLIAPNLVLTAQHCVADTPHLVDCARSVFKPAAAADRVIVTTGSSMWASSAVWLTASDVITPPGGPRVCGHDVALVVLSSPIGADLVSVLAPRLDVSPEQREEYAAIGYGATHGGGDDAGQRRRRDALHVVCVGSACGSTQVDEDEWRGDHGVCSGDSGGPAIDGDGLVIGVTSRAPTDGLSPVYGGLPAHAAWLRVEARRAAKTGAYDEPAWISSTPDDDPAASLDASLDAGAGACATALPGSPRPGPTGPWLVLLVAVAAAAASRRLRR